MEVKVPEELKHDLPQTTFGKILSATPVVMAVVATMLAGLASSEMTRAQYDRSLGAQQQSKAGDQWSFFQAKRVRGALQRNTSELLQTLAAVRPLDAVALAAAADEVTDAAQAASLRQAMTELTGSPAGREAVELMRDGRLPPYPAAPALAPKIQAAIEAVETSVPDQEMERLVNEVNPQAIDDALTAAREQVRAFEAVTSPLNDAIDKMDQALAGISLARQTADSNLAGASIARDFIAARLRYAALRYETEARLNQTIANLYELQVRKSNLSAQRHHTRSQRFFFGMLGAQAGVIISTFAMAARQRNLLWGLAAAAGLIAVAFAIYVYLYV